jgi:PDZ domain
MVSKQVRKWIALGMVGVFAPVAGAFGQGEAPQSAPPNVVPLRVTLRSPAEGEAGGVLALISEGAQEATKVEEVPTGDYYIGIALGELPEVAKRQLHLEHGLVVDDVLPDSPAAKAEFKPQDVLIRVGEQKLEQPADILKAVNESKDKEMRIVLFRDGKEMTLKVIPAKRPKPDSGEARKVETYEARVPSSAIQRIEEALRELKGQDGAARALELYFPRPGVVAQRTVTARIAELPKNLKISITREGDGPAKIHVEREGKVWDTTSDKLDDLPEDVRGQVEQMLSQVIRPMLSARARQLVVPKGANVVPPLLAPQPVAPGTPAVTPSPNSPAATPAKSRLHAYRIAEGKDSLEAKVDQILKKLGADDDDKTLERLRDEVERLRKEVDALKNK